MVAHRMSRVSRVLTSLALLVFAGFAVSIVVDPPGERLTLGDVAVAIVLVALPALAAWRAVARPHLLLTPQVITVVNPFRTLTIPVSSVIDTTEGYSGLVIRYRDGAVVRDAAVWCLQTTNLAALFGWRTRAGRVATEIDRLRDAKPPSTSGGR